MTNREHNANLPRQRNQCGMKLTMTGKLFSLVTYILMRSALQIIRAIVGDNIVSLAIHAYATQHLRIVCILMPKLEKIYKTIRNFGSKSLII